MCDPSGMSMPCGAECDPVTGSFERPTRSYRAIPADASYPVRYASGSYGGARHYSNQEQAYQQDIYYSQYNPCSPVQSACPGEFGRPPLFNCGFPPIQGHTSPTAMCGVLGHGGGLSNYSGLRGSFPIMRPGSFHGGHNNVANSAHPPYLSPTSPYRCVKLAGDTCGRSIPYGTFYPAGHVIPQPQHILF